MAAPNVESQRLISLSLGKIAQSRSQKGGINLHKNLLVATVLHKARTACMMEYQTLQRQRQLEFQQRQQQQQQKDAAAMEFEAKQEQARSAALSLAAFNTSQQQDTIPTCVREMEEEATQSTVDALASPASDPVPRDSSSNLGQVTVSTPPRPFATSESGTGAQATDLGEGEHCRSVSSSSQTQCSDLCNKENSPPSFVTSDSEEFELDLEDSLDTQVVPQSSVPQTPTDHLAAATQLAADAAGLSSRCSDPKQKNSTSASPTCNVLKRQRENYPTVDQECPPASKRARLVAVRRESCTATIQESAASSDTSLDQHTPASDSNQISNLVSIFNSGFTGLCAVSSTPSVRETSSSLTCESVSAQYTTLSPAQPDSLSISPYSRKLSESSLSCSSSLGRLDSVPSSIGLVLTV